MVSSNSLLPPKRVLLLILAISFAISLIFILPVLSPPSSPFYIIDPDIPYVANSLKVTVLNQSSFVNHPGTTLQKFLSFSYWPLRIWAKIIVETPFLDWVLSNFNFFMWYNRSVMALIFFTGLSVLSTAVYVLTRSTISVFIFISYLLLFQNLPGLAMSIRAESFLFLLLSFWALTFAYWYRTQKILLLYLLFYITGLLLATKLTAIFLCLTVTVFLVFYLVRTKPNLLSVFGHIINSFTFLLFAFISGTWIIRSQYIHFFNWASSLFSHSGLYGGGEEKFIVLPEYVKNTLSLFKSNPVLFSFPVLLGFILLFRKYTQKPLLIAVYFSAVSGLITFFKYPLEYYQFVNLIVLGLVSALILASLKFRLKLVILGVFTFSALNSIPGNLVNLRSLSLEAAAVDYFVDNHPPEGAVIWEYSRSRDFALLWGRDWSGDFYAPNLNKLNPHLHDLHNYVYIKRPDLKIASTKDFCWHHFYIQKTSYADFISRNPEYAEFKPEHVPNSSMLFLENSVCQVI